MVPMELAGLYERATTTVSSTFKHCSAVKDFSKKCNHITQVGMTSNSLFIAALASEPQTYQILIKTKQNIDAAEVLLGQTKLNTKVEFILSPNLDHSIGLTDMLILDTYKSYKELNMQLRKHFGYVSKYITIPGTFAFGDRGEDGHSPALMQAIKEFTHANSGWEVIHNSTENNGLIILGNTEQISVDAEKVYSMVSFDIPEVRWIERFTVGMPNLCADLSAQEIELMSTKQLDALNRALRYGVIIGVERNFTILKISQKEIMLGYLVYHVGYSSRPTGV